jgi:cytochrome c peroxidase
LYNIDGKGGYPSYDRGLIDLTRKKEDEGKYRVPVLRNLLFTAPYYHDGSALTLEEVILGYEQGGRIVKNGPFAGDGRINPFKSPLVSGFSLTDTERRDLISFLYSLSDSVLINNKNYANPYR